MEAKRVTVYSVGLCSLSLCAVKDATHVEIEEQANLQAGPTGVGQWKISTEKQFVGGKSNPCQCENTFERQHWLLSC